MYVAATKFKINNIYSTYLPRDMQLLHSLTQK